MDNEPLTERIRARLTASAEAHDVREVRMFGGLSFMVDGSMLVAVRTGDDLLVRVDPARSEDLLGQPGAATAEMGPGRSMGPSWLAVRSEALTTEDGLEYWLRAALDYNGRARGRST